MLPDFQNDYTEPCQQQYDKTVVRPDAFTINDLPTEVIRDGVLPFIGPYPLPASLLNKKPAHLSPISFRHLQDPISPPMLVNKTMRRLALERLFKDNDKHHQHDQIKRAGFLISLYCNASNQRERDYPAKQLATVIFAINKRLQGRQPINAELVFYKELFNYTAAPALTHDSGHQSNSRLTILRNNVLENPQRLLINAQFWNRLLNDINNMAENSSIVQPIIQYAFKINYYIHRLNKQQCQNFYQILLAHDTKLREKIGSAWLDSQQALAAYTAGYDPSDRLQLLLDYIHPDNNWEQPLNAMETLCNYINISSIDQVINKIQLLLAANKALDHHGKLLTVLAKLANHPDIDQAGQTSARPKTAIMKTLVDYLKEDCLSGEQIKSLTQPIVELQQKSLIRDIPDLCRIIDLLKQKILNKTDQLAIETLRKECQSLAYSISLLSKPYAHITAQKLLRRCQTESMSQQDFQELVLTSNGLIDMLDSSSYEELASVVNGFLDRTITHYQQKTLTSSTSSLLKTQSMATSSILASKKMVLKLAKTHIDKLFTGEPNQLTLSPELIGNIKALTSVLAGAELDELYQHFMDGYKRQKLINQTLLLDLWCHLIRPNGKLYLDVVDKPLQVLLFDCLLEHDNLTQNDNLTVFPTDRQAITRTLSDNRHRLPISLFTRLGRLIIKHNDRTVIDHPTQLQWLYHIVPNMEYSFLQAVFSKLQRYTSGQIQQPSVYENYIHVYGALLPYMDKKTQESLLSWLVGCLHDHEPIKANPQQWAAQTLKEAFHNIEYRYNHKKITCYSGYSPDTIKEKIIKPKPNTKSGPNNFGLNRYLLEAFYHYGILSADRDKLISLDTPSPHLNTQPGHSTQ